MYLYSCQSDDRYKSCSKEIVISGKFIFTCWIKMFISQNLLRQKNNRTRNSFNIHRDFRVWEFLGLITLQRKFYRVNPTKREFPETIKKETHAK